MVVVEVLNVEEVVGGEKVVVVVGELDVVKVAIEGTVLVLVCEDKPRIMVGMLVVAEVTCEDKVLVVVGVLVVVKVVVEGKVLVVVGLLKVVVVEVTCEDKVVVATAIR